MEDQDEHYFGLIEKLYPHNTKAPDLRGNVVDVEVYAQANLDYAENYASAYSAFYMSTAGYGSFFDTFAKGRYHFAVNRITEIYHQTNTLDWYLFVGQTGQEIHRAYYDVIGVPKYVPMWACGPIFWRDQNNGGKDEILDDIKRFADLRIPLTACFLDRPYSDGNSNWSKMNFMDKFAEPEKWIKTINETYGLQFMTWAAPMTFGDTDFPGLLPNYKTYIDLTNPEALQKFEARLKTYQYAVGVKGHKMDRTDENFPVTVKWHTPVTESESRNTYVYLYAKVMHEFLTRAHGRDQFNFARAVFHRCQPYLSAVWGGDSRSNWQGMAGNQANAMRCGFMGFPVWGADTGGYLGEGRIDETLYARWLQWGAFNGMFEIKIDGSGGSGEDRPPWKYSQQLQDIFRHVCEQRMALLPTIYSRVNTSHENGVVMKPLAYAFPKDESTYEIWDEYIFANAFLVAPVFTEINTRDIYLPQGTWIDFYDHNVVYQGPVTFTLDVPLHTIPVFVKENAIYITGNIYSGNTKIWDPTPENGRSITIHVLPGEVNDQTTFQYMDYLDNDIPFSSSVALTK
jgi:alpha-glucosidase (family GH31 glycosyl hydrolase)